MFTMTPMHASGLLCFLAVGTATEPICSGLSGDACEQVLSNSMLQTASRASMVYTPTSPGCEDWCSSEYCDWEGGASCGKCAYCPAKPAPTTAPPTTAPPTGPPSTNSGCADWCDKDYCEWVGDDGSSMPCAKCAICPPTPAPTPAAPTPPPTPAPPPFVGTSCDARYLRFENHLSNQAVWHVPGSDPQFPPDSRSISDPDATCGDKAHGIQNSCSIYNQWQTFQQVAKVSSSQAVRVIGPSGVQYTDVGQGALGTCYFLATLASIAYNQPKIIENMFPAKYSKLYEENIYTTRWWLNGKEHLLRVDNQVPAAAGSFVPFFTGLSLTKEFWPLILEKTWAKMFGNYKTQEGGGFTETMLAITRAPTRNIQDIKTDTEKIWAELVGAAARKAPQAAWCKTGKYGLSGSHVYAVLTAEMRSSGRAVKVYNPWRSDNYAGSLDAKDQSDGDGTFWMTLEEFQQAFEWYWISEAITDYQTMGYQAIPGKKSMTVSMTVSSEKKFIVCLNMPKSRILSGAKCKDYLFPEAAMTVCKDNGAGGCADGSVVTGEVITDEGLLFATIDSGSGTYIATVSTEYQDEFKFIKELSVTVYSETAGGLIPMTATPAAAPSTTKTPPPPSTNPGCAEWCDKDWCDWVEEDGSTPCAKCAVCSS